MDDQNVLQEIGILIWGAVGVGVTIAVAVGFTVLVVWIITLV